MHVKATAGEGQTDSGIWSISSFDLAAAPTLVETRLFHPSPILDFGSGAEDEGDVLFHVTCIIPYRQPLGLVIYRVDITQNMIDSSHVGRSSLLMEYFLVTITSIIILLYIILP